MLAHFGGNWNNGANAGLSYWNLNNSSSNANVNIGRQTLIRNFQNYLHPIFLTPWWKFRREEQGLVGFSKFPEANKKVGIL